MTRNAAREIAMHLSYELSFTDLSADELLDQRLSASRFDQLAPEYEVYGELPNASQRTYIRQVVKGIAQHGYELDQYIQYNIVESQLPAGASQSNGIAPEVKPPHFAAVRYGYRRSTGIKNSRHAIISANVLDCIYKDIMFCPRFVGRLRRVVFLFLLKIVRCHAYTVRTRFETMRLQIVFRACSSAYRSWRCQPYS